MDVFVLVGCKLVFVLILWVGNGLLDGMLDFIFLVCVGFVGFYCDEEMLELVEYYFKVLFEMDKCLVIVVDLMFVIGNFLVVVIDMFKKVGVINICFFCFLVVFEGVECMKEVYLDVLIVMVVLDDCFNEKGYIVSGFGDVGDCMFGIK